jgi:hypothetical protein
VKNRKPEPDLAIQMGWQEAEWEHAVDAAELDYGEERFLILATGRCIVFPAAGCDYVRVMDDGCEIAYWSAEEWQEAPADVLGALVGLASDDINVVDAEGNSNFHGIHFGGGKALISAQYPDPCDRLTVDDKGKPPVVFEAAAFTAAPEATMERLLTALLP